MKATLPSKALLGLVLITALSTACEGESFQRQRPDSGTALGPDANAPIPLEVGMRFTYEAILTARQADGSELNSAYRLEYEITEVDDGFASAPTTVTVTATGARTFDDGWEVTREFSSWVGRMGPTRRGDAFDTDEGRIMLDGIAQAPDALTNATDKTLPQLAPLFFDARKLDALEAAFVAEHEDKNVEVVAPDASPTGRWQFRFSGTDPAISIYYENQNFRDMQFIYDERGFLTNLRETLGRTNVRPHAVMQLELKEGPTP